MKKILPLFFLPLCTLMWASCKKKLEIPQPVISGFEPLSGSPGSIISIKGKHLNYVGAVEIGGIQAYFQYTNGNINAEIPSSAISGKITVRSQGKSALSENIFTVLPLTPPPVIKNIQPENNPVNWPILIEGEHIDAVVDITFNGIKAPIDTNFTGVVTTRVPPGITPGMAKLTITTSSGSSTTIPYKVLAEAPNSAPPAPKIMFRSKARYIIRVPNNWFNEFGNHSIFIFSEGAEGTEELNGISYPFTVTAINNSNKTIELRILRGFDIFYNEVYEIYKGTYVDSGVPNQENPNIQRIIFYNEAGRQIVVFTPV